MRNDDGGEIHPESQGVIRDRTTSRYSVRAIVGKIFLHAGFLLVAVVAFGAYEHFNLAGQTTPSWISLVIAAGFGLAPIRAVLRELFLIESKILHLVHGLGGLVLGGLAIGGVVSGGPILSHAALAPFAIMGAAQAMMHQEHPRNAEQATALRRFVASLPEVAQFTKSGDLSSPANVRRAITVLTDIVAKAQALGETELKSDPGFQSALKRVTTHFGLSLGLDVVQEQIKRLAKNPAAANSLPELRKQLALARKKLDGK